MRLTLTDISVRQLRPPTRGQKMYRDETLAGFGVRVSQAGAKTFVLVHGRQRQFLTIGRYPIITLAQARAEAKRILAEKILGQHQPRSIKFEDAYDLFKTHHCATKKPRTSKDYRRMIEVHFLPKLREDRLETITSDALCRITDKLADTPSEQAHAIAVARMFFRWCVGRRYLKHSQLEGVSVISSTPRDRALDDNEIARVYLAARNLGYPFGPFTQLALILGQRRGEIAALRRSWINMIARTITFPREVMKGNRPHVIPYGSIAAVIFESLPPSGELLFPARGTIDRPLSGFSKFKLALDNEVGTIDPFTIHDLRRSFASGLQRIGIRIDVTERLLAHRSGSFAGIVSVYQQHDLMPEMRDAVSKWEAHVASLLVARKQVSAARAA